MTIFCKNRKAHYDYDIIETIEAGIVLKGTEIKSILQHHVSLDGAYAVVQNGQINLIGCQIEPYSHGNTNNHDPNRPKRLLLHKREIQKFAEKAQQKGFTLIPLSIYRKNGKAKIELGIAKGKQTHDKRQSLKTKDAEREMRHDSN